MSLLASLVNWPIIVGRKSAALHKSNITTSLERAVQLNYFLTFRSSSGIYRRKWEQNFRLWRQDMSKGVLAALNICDAKENSRTSGSVSDECSISLLPFLVFKKLHHLAYSNSILLTKPQYVSIIRLLFS